MLSLLILSPFVGSFLGVLIARLPAGRTVVFDRSRCESCAHPLGPRDLVPVLSWLALRGRCRHCHAPIGRFPLLVELAAIAVTASALLADPDPARRICDCLLGWTLLALAWIDWRAFILPDMLTLPLLLVGLIEAALLPALLPVLTSGEIVHDPGLLASGLIDLGAAVPRALAAALAWAIMALTAWTYRRLRHRDGLGGGDAKLFAAGAAWIGPDALPACLLGASLIGLAAALPMLPRHGRAAMTRRIPFGPPLALSIWACRLFWPG